MSMGSNKQPGGSRQALDYFKRGSACVEEGDYAGAIANFSSALKLRPRSVRAYARRAFAHFRKRDYRRALFDYSKVIELLPDNIHARFCRGRLLDEIGRYDQAIADFTTV